MHDGGTVVVVVLGPLVGAVDVEESDGAAVQPLHLDVAQLAAAREREAAQEKVVGSDHRRLLLTTERRCSAIRASRSRDTPRGPKCA